MLLIFDLDGTIVDTWEEIKITFEMVFAKKGIPLDYIKLRMAIGLPLNKVIEKLIGQEDIKLMQEIRQTFLALYPRRIKMFDGMREILNIPVKKAILTSKGEMGTIRDLKYLGIVDKFSIIITADRIKHKKPDPEGIYTILKKTCEKKENVFMIGDTEVDILSAKNAGVNSIAVAWGYRNREFLKSYNPNFIVTTGKELKAVLQNHDHL